jgi:hypothetical protein
MIASERWLYMSVPPIMCVPNPDKSDQASRTLWRFVMWAAVGDFHSNHVGGRSKWRDLLPLSKNSRLAFYIAPWIDDKSQTFNMGVWYKDAAVDKVGEVTLFPDFNNNDHSRCRSTSSPFKLDG